MASFSPLAYEAYLTWGSAQCGRSLHILSALVFVSIHLPLSLSALCAPCLFSSRPVSGCLLRWTLFRLHWEICLVQQKQGEKMLRQELLAKSSRADPSYEPDRKSENMCFLCTNTMILSANRKTATDFKNNILNICAHLISLSVWCGEQYFFFYSWAGREGSAYAFLKM